MLSLPVEHPDIEEFIDAKKDLSKINYANTSVMVSDAFMEAVRDDLDWEMRFEVKDTGEVISKTVSAKKLFRKLAQNNWEQAEPGILFWDTVQNYHINGGLDELKFSSTNPCNLICKA